MATLQVSLTPTPRIGLRHLTPRVHTPHEQKIRGEQRAGRAIKCTQVAVRMRDRVSGELQEAATEVDLRVIADQERWDYERAGGALPQHRLESPAVVLPALYERIREPRVPHEDAVIPLKRSGTKNMIRMDMRHHDVTDGQIRNAPNARAQAFAIRKASAAVHHRDGIGSDDEADIRDRACIAGRRVLVCTATDVNAARNLLYGKCYIRAASTAGEGGRTTHAQRCKQNIAAIDVWHDACFRLRARMDLRAPHTIKQRVD